MTVASLDLLLIEIQTCMAAALAHDVSAFCVASGSPVYFCNLDAEGAFGCIPRHVLFNKATNIIPDDCWHMLYQWYSNMNIKIRWNGVLGNQINVERGTRQGGLTSPLLFNILYKDLVNELQNCDSGICTWY